MSTSDITPKPPQDVVAIFHASFHPTQGNVIDWSVKASDSLDLTHVEFSSLPSGLHLIDQDVVYFTKDEHQGVCVFRRRKTTAHGHRGFRLSSLGILLAKSPRPRPWRHVPALKALVQSIYTSLEDREALEPTEHDWEPARAFFEERKVVRADLGGSGDWRGWMTELDASNSSTVQTSPTMHLPHLLRILGPSSLTLYKHVLGRRRVLIYTAPPVEPACVLCQVAADICYEDQINENNVEDPDIPKPDDAAPESRRILKGKEREGIKVLGVVTLNDLDKLQQESKSGRGWVACTTDAIFLEKTSYYDLVIDLTTSNPSKFARPTLYIPRPAEQSGTRGLTHRLSAVRFTWSDVKLWNELERLMSLDSGICYNSCCDPASSSSSRARPNTGAGWTDMWRVYEDVCVLCAGIWMGSWRNSPTTPRDGSRMENWGSIRLEGDDYFFASRDDESLAYVRNVGMGIEGRPPAVEPSNELGVLHNRTPRAMRRSSGISMWTWASGRNPTESPKSIALDEGMEIVEDASTLREKQVMTTLALLQTFHKNTSLLLSRLTTLLPQRSSQAQEDDDPKTTVVLTPKDLITFDLGPLSALDARFIEWLADEYGDGVRVTVRRGWRDLVGIVLGFG